MRNSIDLTTNRKTSEIIDNANIVAKKIKIDTEDIIKLESLRLKLEVESIILEKSLEIAKLEIRKEINDENSTSNQITNTNDGNTKDDDLYNAAIDLI